MSNNSKNLKDMIQHIKDIIRNKEKIFYLNTFILAVLFLVINFFIGFAINIYKYNEYAERNIQIKVGFIDSTNLSRIKEIENELILDKNVNYIKYIPKEIAFKNLEEELDMELGSENPLSDSMIIYLKGIKTLEDLGKAEFKITQTKEFNEVLIKRDYISKVLSFKRNLTRIIRAMSIFLIIPLVLLFYFIFGLNFSYLEEEIRMKYSENERKHKILIILPYFITKVFTLLGAWILALIVFIPFYEELVWQLYEINPFITLASIKEMKSFLIGSFFITLALLIVAGMFFRNPAKEKE